MDGASDEQGWWVRRAVLALLLVVGIATTAYAVVETRAGTGETADETGIDPSEVVTTIVPGQQTSEGPLRLGEVLVVGRHGSPVEMPEGTAESFAAALDAGVDYLEAEVVMTKDDELVVRDDNELSRSTDVADRPEFADRETTKTVDGVETAGWFSEDFTLDELRSLRAIEPDPELRPASAEYDGDHAVIGFDDFLTQLADFNLENATEIGVFVQPRRASYFRGLRLPMERAIAKSLRRARLVNEPERVTVESSDLALLQRLEDNVGDNVLSAFVVDSERGDAAQALEADALAELPSTIDLVAVEVAAFAGQDAFDLSKRIHDAGFAMAVYPISYENALLGDYFRVGDDPSAPGNLEGQVDGLRMIGVDVLLAESPVEVIETLTALELADPEGDGQATG